MRYKIRGTRCAALAAALLLGIAVLLPAVKTSALSVINDTGTSPAAVGWNTMTEEEYAAEAGMYDYETEAFEVDMRVEENHTVHVQETITVDFGAAHHGITRYIPIDQKEYDVRNITVPGNETKITRESNQVNIRIGNAKKTLMGEQKYVLNYDLLHYKDNDPGGDQFLTDLLPTGWDTPIAHAVMTVTFPSPIEADALQLFVGSYGDTAVLSESDYSLADDGRTLRVEGNYLAKGCGVTALASLPEGYWKNVPGGKAVPVWIYVLLTAAPVITAVLWILFGRDPEVVETVEFEPPQGMTPAEAGYAVDGTADDGDLSAMLLYFAEKGWLKLMKDDAAKKRKRFIAIYRKDPDPDEKQFVHTLFSGLFKEPKTKTVDGQEEKVIFLHDMPEDYARTINKAKKELASSQEAALPLYTKQSRAARKAGNLLLAALIFITAVAGFRARGSIEGKATYYAAFLLLAGLAVGARLVMMSFEKWRSRKKSTNVSSMAIGLALLCVVAAVPGYSLGVGYHRMWLAGMLLISFFVTLFFTTVMLSRSEESAALQGRLLGFRGFIENAEYERIRLLSESDPEYFFHILPYAMVFDLSVAWAEHFTNIQVRQPDWYMTGNPGGYILASDFSKTMDSTTRSWSSQFHNSPDSGGSDGGGGFSGGGSGGGGGGAW
ncbi:MAG: DUF2207 domain-containing protein [Eubacterium sp.]|nr:DUF2207 domain-containing protein [Eubacterium sp.]